LKHDALLDGISTTALIAVKNSKLETVSKQCPSHQCVALCQLAVKKTRTGDVAARARNPFNLLSGIFFPKKCKIWG